MSSIEYLNQLRADLEQLARADSQLRSPRRPNPRRMWLVAVPIAGLILIGVIALVDHEQMTGSPSANVPGGVQRSLGLPQPPFGSNPFFTGGRDVSAKTAARAFDATIRFGAGPLVEPDSPAANPANRIHIWMGPFGRRQKVFIFEYKSGIRVVVRPLTRIPYKMTPAQVRSAFTHEVAQDPAKLLHLATINGLPALVSHGNGKVIPIPDGSESMNGTSVTLFLNHLSIQVSANRTVPENQVLAAASSLAPISTIG